MSGIYQSDGVLILRRARLGGRQAHGSVDGERQTPATTARIGGSYLTRHFRTQNKERGKGVEPSARGESTVSAVGPHAHIIGSVMSSWERLSEASTRVMEAAAISKDEAQTVICRAISDGDIGIRCKLGRHATRHFTSVDTELFREDFQVPTHLKTEDFDWERSRPSKPWLVRTGHHRLPGYWNLEWIKLSRADVTDRLCPVKEQDDSTQHASSESPATSTSRQTLESQEMPVGSGPRSTAGPRKGAAGPARHRGPRPKKFEQARDAMRNDLQQGRLTAAGLETMLEKTLAADYGVSRDTARKARKAVLSELGEN